MIPNTNEIKMYIHCGLCIGELPEGPAGQSPSDYADLEIGWTELGIQVWCKRHSCNVVHIDFEGQQHPANDARIPVPAPVKLVDVLTQDRAGRAEFIASLDIAEKMGLQVIHDQITGTTEQLNEHQHRLESWRNSYEHRNQGRPK